MKLIFASGLFMTLATACLLSNHVSAREFENINHLDKLIFPTKTDNNFCQGCKSVVSFITRFNSTENHNEYKDLIQNFCQLYYPPSTDFRQGPCNLATELSFAIMKKINPIFYCDKLGACSETDGDDDDNNYDLESSLDAPPKVNNIICDACIKGFKQFKKQLQDPKFIDQLHEYVISFCDYLKVIDMDKECRQEFNDYINQAISFIKQLDPKKYCKSVQLCSSTLSINSKQNQLDSTLASLHGFGLETTVELNGETVRNIDDINPKNIYNNDVDDDDENLYEGSSLTNHKNGPNCMLCKVIVKELSKIIRNNKSEEYIENSLLKVCSLIYKKGNPNLEQCNDMVAAYTKELIELLADESNPEIVCMLIEQCAYQKENKTNSIQDRKELSLSTQSVTTLSDTKKSAEEQTFSFGEFIASMDPEIPVSSVRTCVECKLFVKYLQDTFEDQKSRESFREYLLENLCNSLKEQELKDSCTKMVNQYSDYFFKAIADQLDPGTVCLDLKACRKHNEATPLYVELDSPSKFEEELITGFVPPAKNPLDTYRSAFCNQCVDVVTKLDEYLASHSVDDDVKVLIEQVCNKLPDQQSQETCKLIVKTLGQKIVETLHTMDNPKQVCQTIYLC